MKVNLKNKPQLIYLEDILTKEELGTFMDFLQANFPKVSDAWVKNKKENPEAWFEGFEKELRQRLAQIEKDDIEFCEFSLGNATKIVKEILGEQKA